MSLIERFAQLRAHALPLSFLFFLLYAPFVIKHGCNAPRTPQIDLPSFYAASIEVFRHRQTPYQPKALQTRMGQGMRVFPYLYPPQSILLFSPLSFLTYRQAQRFSLIINHLFFLSLFFLLPFLLFKKESPFSFPFFFLISIVYLTSFSPIVGTLRHGQINLFLLFCLLIAWFLIEEKKILWAGFFLMLAIYLKTYPILLLPMLWLIGRRREVASTVGWLLGSTLLAWFVLPSILWRDWFVKILPSGGYGQIPAELFSPASIANQSLNAFFLRTFTETPWSSPVFVDAVLARRLGYLSALFLFFCSALVLWQARKNTATSLSSVFLITLPMMYLIAPLSWEHHLVYLLPSIFLLLFAPLKGTRAVQIFFRASVLGIALLLGLENALEWKVYGVMALWGMGSWFVSRQQRD